MTDGLMKRRARYAHKLNLSVARMRQRDDEGEGISPRSFCDYGLEVDTRMLVVLDAIDRDLHASQRRIQGAIDSLRGLLRAEYPVARDHIEMAITVLMDAQDRVRNARPRAICPECKGMPGLQERCTYCDRRGWISRAVWDEHHEGYMFNSTDVRVDGRAVPMKEYLEAYNRGLMP